jgi:hypothetical protein
MTGSSHENLTNLYDMPAYKIGYMLSGNSFLTVSGSRDAAPGALPLIISPLIMPFFPFGKTTVME